MDFRQLTLIIAYKDVLETALHGVPAQVTVGDGDGDKCGCGGHGGVLDWIYPTAAGQGEDDGLPGRQRRGSLESQDPMWVRVVELCNISR